MSFKSVKHRIKAVWLHLRFPQSFLVQVESKPLLFLKSQTSFWGELHQFHPKLILELISKPDSYALLGMTNRRHRERLLRSDLVVILSLTDNQNWRLHKERSERR